MVANENPKGPNQPKNAKNAQNTQNTPKFSSKPIIESFIEKQLSQDIFAFENVDFSQTFQDFKNFLQVNHPENLQDFLEIEKYNLMLKKLIVQNTAGIGDMYEIINQKLDQEYSLTPENHSKIKDFLSNKKKSDLKYYTTSQLGRKDLLKKLKISSTSKEKDDDALLQDIFGDISPDVIRNNPEKMLSLHRFTQAKKIEIGDFQNLFHSITQPQIAKILEYFLPVIPLKEAQDFGLISKEKSKNHIKQILQKYIGEADDVEVLIKNIDPQDIFISTKDIFAGKSHDDLISNDTFIRKITKEWNDSIDYVEQNKEIKDKEDFLEAVAKSKNISDDIKKSLKNFEAGSTFVVTEGKRKQYFSISSLSEKSEFFEVINVTKGSGVRKEKEKGIKEQVFFLSFFELLQNISADEKEKKFECMKKEEIQEKNITEVPESENIATLTELETLLDEIDTEGKGIKIKEMAFYYTPSQEFDDEEKKRRATSEDVLFVKKSDDQNITLSNGQTLSLNDFYDAFVSLKPKRFKQINNPTDFLTELKKTENFKDLLKDVDLTENRLIPKSMKENKDFAGIQYFIIQDNDKKEKSVRIKKITDSQIYIEEGEYVEGEVEKKDGEKKKKPDTFTRKRHGTLDYTTFFHYLKGKKFDTQKIDAQVEDEDVKNAKELKLKRGFFKGWFGGCLSIKEMLAGGKQVTSAIEHYLEQGNKLKSAKFALAMGKFLPEGLRKDLENIVEGEQKKTMEEIMSKLKSMNSKQMVDTIWEYVQTSRPGDPELEAALMTMASKYGNLYNKMEKNRGNFAWYQALGGRVGDKLFMEEKQKCLDAEAQAKKDGKPQPVPFTEERLVEALLKQQVKPDSDYYPKRRNKFDKEYGGALNGGLAEEMQDGENKTSDMITLKGRMGYVLGEFVDGGYANGVGGIKKVWGKGGSPKEMNAFPFLLAATGLSNSFTEGLMGKLVGEIARGSPYPMMLFNMKGSSVKVFQSTVERLIAQKYPTLLTSYKDALKSKDKIKDVYNFWMTHGDKLVQDLNLSNDYLLLQKDIDGNEVYKEYYEFYTGMMTDDEYSLKKDDVDTGKYDAKQNPINAEIGKVYYEKHFSVNTSGVMDPVGERLFKSTMEQLESLRNNTDLNNSQKFQIYSKYHTSIEYAIRKRADIGSQSFQRSMIALNLKKVGIDINPSDRVFELGDLGDDYTTSDRYKNYVTESFQKFLANRVETPEDVQEVVPLRVSEILSQMKASQTQESVDDIIKRNQT